MILNKKVGTLNLSEIDNLLNHNSQISDLGESINAIFYSVDPQKKIRYLNSKARSWMNLDSHPSEDLKDIDISSYFEDHIIYMEYTDPDNELNLKTVKYFLQNVWFPIDLDFKLCIISTCPCSISNETLCTIVPLQDWKHLKKRLVSLIKEEEFIRENTEKYNALTKREKQVLKLISKGLNSKEISGRLFISKHTVEQHRKNARKKLGTNTSAELLKFGRVFE